MRDLDRSTRLCVYEHFVRAGTAPSLDEIAHALSCTTGEVEASLTRLELEYHALTLAPTTKTLWMAHPFSAVPTPFRVETDAVAYWANCAWDAVAIPSMLGVDARVHARCAESGSTMDLVFRNGVLDRSSEDGIVHFVVPPRAFWNNVAYT